MKIDHLVYIECAVQNKWITKEKFLSEPIVLSEGRYFWIESVLCTKFEKNYNCM